MLPTRNPEAPEIFVIGLGRDDDRFGVTLEHDQINEPVSREVCPEWRMASSRHGGKDGPLEDTSVVPVDPQVTSEILRDATDGCEVRIPILIIVGPRAAVQIVVRTEHPRQTTGHRHILIVVALVVAVELGSRARIQGNRSFSTVFP